MFIAYANTFFFSLLEFRYILFVFRKQGAPVFPFRTFGNIISPLHNFQQFFGSFFITQVKLSLLKMDKRSDNCQVLYPGKMAP